MNMVIAMFKWWYAGGWGDFARRIFGWLQGILDHFSIGLLLRTLFQPFRQISALTPDNISLGESIRYFFDRLVSRIIGAIVRLILIFTGMIILIFGSILGLVGLIIWPFLPLILPASIALATMGVVF